MPESSAGRNRDRLRRLARGATQTATCGAAADNRHVCWQPIGHPPPHVCTICHREWEAPE